MNPRHFFKNLRIRNKLLVSYTALFFLFAILNSVALYSLVRRTIESNIDSELKNSTATILNMVRTSATTSIKNYLRSVAEKNLEIAQHFYQRYTRGEISEAEAKQQIAQIFLSQSIGTTGYIYCLSSKGIIKIHPKKELLGADLTTHAFIRDQMARWEGYLEYDWKNPGEKHLRPKALYMTYFEPWDWIISVSSYREEFIELVNVDDFRESILSLKFGQTGYSYVLDTTGNLIVHPKLEGHNFYDIKDARGRYYIREICERKSGKTAYSWKNPDEQAPREKVVIFNYIPEFKWIVASSSYEEEFYRSLTTVRNVFLFSGIAFLSLVLPLTLTISESITNPLQELMHRFALGIEGDMTVRMERQSEDEIGKLAHYFNAFMDRLDASKRSLQAEMNVRRKAEATIRESEAKYRELVQNANSIILRLDTEGRITFFNEYAQHFFGKREAAILGLPMAEALLAPGHRAQSWPDRLTQNGSLSGGIETECVERSGQRVWISWTSRSILGKAGQVVEYLCVGNDVTASRRAAHEIARMRRYLKSIVDAMPSVLVGIDSHLRVTLWNREAEKVAGFSESQTLGRPLAKVLPLLENQMVVVRHALSEQVARKQEKWPVQNRAGRQYFDLMVYPLSEHELEGAVIRLDDVSARVRMEEIMVQTEKMMSVGGLAAGMAHEINNPLGAILQSTQNIHRRLSPDLSINAEVASACGFRLKDLHCYLNERGINTFLEGIRTSGERAANTVANMLSFSRRSELGNVPTDLARLVDRTVELAAHDYDLKKKYDFRSFEIVREFASNLPKVPCHPNEIEQVVLNLLRNAVQAAAEAPQIVLRLKHEADQVLMEVEDNGVGMDDETRKRVFEPFYTTKDIGVGTGLGLSVSYFIITSNHRGTMTVESEPGQGALFRIWLPLAGTPGAGDGLYDHHDA